MKKIYINFLLLLLCANEATAQSFVGEWSDAAALSAVFKGDFHTKISPARVYGTPEGVVESLDSCVMHTYRGKVNFNNKEVFSRTLGKYFFSGKLFTNEKNTNYCWQITGTTDGFDCLNCATALSGALWECTAKGWQTVFVDKDFAQRGNSGVLPSVSFDVIGEEGQIGVVCWEQRHRDSTDFFFYADIFTPTNKQFVQITASVCNAESEYPNICNSVSRNPEHLYSYETKYDFVAEPKKEIYDIIVERKGTMLNSAAPNGTRPTHTSKRFRWVDTNYILIDSASVTNYALHTAHTGETFYTLAKTYSTTSEEIKTLNPYLQLRTGTLLTSDERIYVPAATAVSIEDRPAPSFSNKQNGTAQKPAAIATTPIAEATDTDSKGTIKQHTVADKETLFSIANKYKIQLSNIAKYNNLTEPYILQKGQVLLLEKSKK